MAVLPEEAEALPSPTEPGGGASGRSRRTAARTCSLGRLARAAVAALQGDTAGGLGATRDQVQHRDGQVRAEHAGFLGST